MARMPSYFVACDLGAESGRVILGNLQNGFLTIEEIHRFSNVVIVLDGTMRWDVLRLFHELKKGLSLLGQRGVALTSLSVDSWGVDYAWSGLGQSLLSAAHCYRDPRTEPAYTHALATVGPEKIFAETGLQFMPLNTLYQLLTDAADEPRLVDAADRFLCIADFLNFLFCGIPRAEESLASTTQLYNPITRSWSSELIATFNLPERIFPQIVQSGTALGSVRTEILEETGLAPTQVVATCSHDTGAAIAAVPAEAGEDWAYLSSGTWSLIGVELPSPLINAATREANFTNEGGFDGTTRFLKNITGLWILQECRRDWERRGHAYDYAELNRLAAESHPFRTLINPNDPRFLRAGDMQEKLAAFARETSQPIPATPGEFTRAVLESLALLYREALATIEELTSRKIRVLHIVGGGSQSVLLNQFAADATGRDVIAGPVEATAIGNTLIQAIVAGEVASLAELRACVRKSFPVLTYHPTGESAWTEVFSRFESLRGSNRE